MDIINFWRENKNFEGHSGNFGLRNFFRPPKLGARSPPMATYYVSIRSHVGYCLI